MNGTDKIFDPFILKEKEKNAFKCIIPNWDDIPTFSKPTEKKVYYILKNVNLQNITDVNKDIILNPKKYNLEDIEKYSIPDYLEAIIAFDNNFKLFDNTIIPIFEIPFNEIQTTFNINDKINDEIILERSFPPLSGFNNNKCLKSVYLILNNVYKFNEKYKETDAFVISISSWIVDLCNEKKLPLKKSIEDNILISNIILSKFIDDLLNYNEAYINIRLREICKNIEFFVYPGKTLIDKILLDYEIYNYNDKNMITIPINNTNYIDKININMPSINLLIKKNFIIKISQTQYINYKNNTIEIPSIDHNKYKVLIYLNNKKNKHSDHIYTILLFYNTLFKTPDDFETGVKWGIIRDMEYNDFIDFIPEDINFCHNGKMYSRIIKNNITIIMLNINNDFKSWKNTFVRDFKIQFKFDSFTVIITLIVLLLSSLSIIQTITSILQIVLA